MKKYELTDETTTVYGKTLYRIKALRDFSDVKAGDLGGFIQSEDNLAHEDNCWVYDNAKVWDNIKISYNLINSDNDYPILDTLYVDILNKCISEEIASMNNLPNN